MKGVQIFPKTKPTSDGNQKEQLEEGKQFEKGSNESNERSDKSQTWAEKTSRTAEIGQIIERCKTFWKETAAITSIDA